MLALLLALAAAAPTGEATADVSALMKQAAAAWRQAHAAWRDGKRAEAVVQMEEARTRARRATGEAHRDQLLALETLAEWDQSRAAGHRQEYLRVSRLLHGPASPEAAVAYWDWRLAVRLASMTEDERGRMTKAREEYRGAFRHFEAGRYREAVPPAGRAAAAFAALLGEGFPDTWRSRTLLALARMSLGDLAAARPVFHDAAAYYRAAYGEEHPHFANALNYLGMVYQSLGRHRDAIPIHRAALAIRWAAHGPSYRTWESLNNLAGAVLDAGDPRAALPIYRGALEMAMGVMGEKHPKYFVGLNNLALLCRDLFEHDEALPLQERAVELAKASVGERHVDYAAALHNLALLCQDMGDYRRSLALEERAAAIVRRSLGVRHPHYASCLMTIGLLRLTLGDPAQARRDLDMAVTVTKAALGERHPAFAAALGRCADLYHRLADHAAAEALGRAAVDATRVSLGARHPEYARRLDRLAWYTKHAGRYHEALLLAELALAAAEEATGPESYLYAKSLNTLALILSDLHQPRKALPLLLRAAEVESAKRGGKGPSAGALHNLATVYRDTGETARALDLFEKAREAGITGENLQSNLAILRLDTGEAAEARRLADGALASATSRLRAASMAQSERAQLEAAMTLSFHLGVRLSVPIEKDDAAGCYRHVLAWKGAIFLRQHRSRQLARLSADPATRDEAARLEQATCQLIALSARPDAPPARLHYLSGLVDDLQARLSERVGGLRDRPTPTAAELAASLPEGAAVVDYLVHMRRVPPRDGVPRHAEYRLCAFVTRRGKASVRVDLGPAEAVEGAVTAWRKRIEAGGAGGGAALKALVWRPLQKHLEGVNLVIVSPDEALGMAPFAALPGEKEGTYLIEDVALVVSPQPQTLPTLLAAGTPKVEPSLLAVGRVEYGGAAGAAWAALPATGPEAESAAARFGARFPHAPRKTLTGADATKAAVREALAGARHAHLATHGFFSPRRAADGRRSLGEAALGWNPLLLSGLVLAGANKEGGILTALEVSEMDLSKLDLAVLSACETGLGSEKSAEGMLGLQRAFAVAGCQSVVSSLWSVDDAATSVLMERFYFHLWEKKRPKLDALRQAQLDVLRDPALVEARGKELAGTRGLRGAGKASEVIVSGKKERRSPVAWWAAWQLSGDWR